MHVNSFHGFDTYQTTLGGTVLSETTLLAYYYFIIKPDTYSTMAKCVASHLSQFLFLKVLLLFVCFVLFLLLFFIVFFCVCVLFYAFPVNFFRFVCVCVFLVCVFLFFSFLLFRLFVFSVTLMTGPSRLCVSKGA